MRLLAFLLSLLLTPVAWSQESPQKQLQVPPPISTVPPPLSTVDEQLRQAQAEFEVAKKMFNPWYAGPLLTPGAHNVPPGHYVLQAYLFVQDTHAVFNKDRRSQDIPDIWSVRPVMLFQMGWLSRLDFSISMQGFYKTQSGKDTFYFGDTSLGWGVQLQKEKPYRPAIRFSITESLPTGRYDKLNPAKNGIDATGSGAYTTTFALNFSKIFWWMSTHPFALRGSLSYAVPMVAQVQGFNAYGGGRGTRGRVRPGNSLAIDAAIELSFTQRWVFALDLVYSYQNRSTFSGHKGRTLARQIASVGAPSNDSLSAAPAIEYNPSDHMGILAGVWFTVIGRNSADFIAGVLSVYYAW